MKPKLIDYATVFVAAFLLQTVGGRVIFGSKHGWREDMIGVGTGLVAVLLCWLIERRRGRRGNSTRI